MAITDTHTHGAATVEAHLGAFADVVPTLPGGTLPWLQDLRADAFARFAENGLPTRRIEDWKFTRLDALAKEAFAPSRGTSADAPDVSVDMARALAPEGAAARLVFVNGAFSADLSDLPEMPNGVHILPLGRALDEAPELAEGRIGTGDDKAGILTALNAAFMANGAVIAIDDDIAFDGVISLVFVASGTEQAAHHIRNIIDLGRGAKARVTETYAGIDGAAAHAFTNAVTDVRLGNSAKLSHARVQTEGAEALHLSHAHVRIGEGADYSSFALGLGATLSRQESDVAFTGPEGRLQLLGVTLGRNRQHIDHTTRVDHAYPGCSTEELFKSVLDDRAHGVFQGLLRVAPHAIRTDARQQNHNLLLSDRAVADAKPELEILADDVKCAHGATVGDLDADELFYMAARGIPYEAARRLLIAGFLSELTERFADAEVGSWLAGRLENWQGAI